MEKKLLEVGDVLYTYGSWNSGLNKHTIERVSPKQAFAKGLTVRREIEEKSHYNSASEYTVRLIGSYGSAYLPTDELNNKYEDQQTRRKAWQLHTSVKIDQMDLTQVKALIGVYESLIKATGGTK